MNHDSGDLAIRNSKIRDCDRLKIPMALGWENPIVASGLDFGLAGRRAERTENRGGDIFQ